MTAPAQRLCACGCGQATLPSQITDRRFGQPNQFVKGHNGRCDPETRLLSRVREGEGGCWLWTGPVNPVTGYAKLHVGDREVLAHRFAYERFRGPIPKGLQIDHLCRHRACVNPEHLEVVTQVENLRRGRAVRAGGAQ